MKLAIVATLLATASAFSVEKADLGKVRNSEEQEWSNWKCSFWSALSQCLLGWVPHLDTPIADRRLCCWRYNEWPCCSSFRLMSVLTRVHPIPWSSPLTGRHRRCCCLRTCRPTRFRRKCWQRWIRFQRQLRCLPRRRTKRNHAWKDPRKGSPWPIPCRRTQRKVCHQPSHQRKERHACLRWTSWWRCHRWCCRLRYRHFWSRMGLNFLWILLIYSKP